MQDETTYKPKTPQGSGTPPENHKPRNNSNGRKRSGRGRNEIYQREAVRKRMIQKFFALVGIMVGVFLVAAFVGVMAYNHSTAAKADALAVSDTPAPTVSAAGSSSAPAGNVTTAAPSASDVSGDDSSLLLPPEKTTFLIVGEDASGLLTDVILVGTFNRDTCEINLVSVPRDTYTVLPEARIDKMHDLGLYPPSDGIMKMNAVHSYGGTKYGMMLLQEELEDVLQIDIDYEIEINLKAFRNIVDALGGVYMNIPQRLYTSDPSQNLLIDLQPGFQYLDGAQAEGLARYRDTYRNGDLDRINVQHELLTALFTQVLQRDNIVNNAYTIVTNILSYTKTNFPATDIPKYLRYVNQLSADKLHFYTLPGVGDTVTQSGRRVSYFFPDKDKMQEFIDDVFYDKGTYVDPDAPTESPAVTGPPAANSIGARIEILNGAGASGLAGDFKNKLESDGFTVTDIGDYASDRAEETRIVVNRDGLGTDLEKYFKSSTVTVDPNMPGDFDIIIILGTGEA